MAPLKKRKVEGSLQKKGFKQKDGDHNFFVYYTEAGLQTAVQTKTSFTPKQKDISAPLQSMMAKQCHLSNQDFCDLINCPLSRRDYERKLKAGGII